MPADTPRSELRRLTCSTLTRERRDTPTSEVPQDRKRHGLSSWTITSLVHLLPLDLTQPHRCTALRSRVCSLTVLTALTAFAALTALTAVRYQAKYTARCLMTRFARALTDRTHAAMLSTARPTSRLVPRALRPSRERGGVYCRRRKTTGTQVGARASTWLRLAACGGEKGDRGSEPPSRPSQAACVLTTL